jgi:hypothetical protein
VPIGPFGETLTWPRRRAGAADEEEVLAGDPGALLIVDPVEDLAHTVTVTVNRPRKQA